MDSKTCKVGTAPGWTIEEPGHHSGSLDLIAGNLLRLRSQEVRQCHPVLDFNKHVFDRISLERSIINKNGCLL